MILIGYKENSMNEQELKFYRKGLLEKISPTFCFAKWHHSTIYLQLGQTHSCYHPPPHEIKLDEIKVNPSALHNTCLLYTSPSPRDRQKSRMPSSA